MKDVFRVAQQRGEYACEILAGARLRLSHSSSSEHPEAAVRDFVYQVARAGRELDAAVDELISARDKLTISMSAGIGQGTGAPPGFETVNSRR